jgi:CHAD domain-containing protein
MPKAWDVDSLAADMPLSHAAAVILRVKLPEVLSYEAAAAGGEVEGIHDMRVAAKRLREAVRVLRPALPTRHHKALLRQVEALNDSLGLVRDADVIAGALLKIARRDPRAKPLQHLAQSLSRDRDRHHQALLRFLRQLHQDNFEDLYDSVMEEMATAPAAGQPTLGAFAHEAITTRLNEVEAHQDIINTPWEVEAFHRQRIRVKKLKYALEPFLALLPGIEESYDQIAEVQELMGLVHDCDVQTEVLQDWERQQGTAPGLSVGQDLIAQTRRRALCRLREHLNEMQAAGYPRPLQETLQQLVRSAG